MDEYDDNIVDRYADDLTVDNFNAWINDQDTFRVLNHSSWDTCAVGEFIDWVTQGSDVDKGSVSWLDLKDYFLEELYVEANGLHCYLDEAIPGTYGDLQRAIDEDDYSWGETADGE